MQCYDFSFRNHRHGYSLHLGLWTHQKWSKTCYEDEPTYKKIVFRNASTTRKIKASSMNISGIFQLQNYGDDPKSVQLKIYESIAIWKQ